MIYFGFANEEPYVSTDEVLAIPLEIFPNPVIDQLQVKIPESLSSINSIEVTDLYGRMLYREKLENNQRQLNLNTSDYSPGVYLIHVHIGDNQRVVSKFIKQ